MKSSASSAFTLVETMVTMAIFLLVLSGILSSYMYGLRMFEYTKPKLSASDDARAAISRLMNEVRTASIVRIGTGDQNSFSEVAMNAIQAGSAIQVYPNTDTNSFMRYYLDGAVNQLKRTDSTAPGSFTVLAQNVTNQVVFTAEDFTGSTLTNNLNNRVVGLTLQFNQIQYPVMQVGPGNFYDFYQLRTKITRRTLL
jgi:Tfp pilus assembly protein PilW